MGGRGFEFDDLGGLGRCGGSHVGIVTGNLKSEAGITITITIKIKIRRGRGGAA
jgi:hypothetical protein